MTDLEFLEWCGKNRVYHTTDIVRLYVLADQEVPPHVKGTSCWWIADETVLDVVIEAALARADDPVLERMCWVVPV